MQKCALLFVGTGQVSERRMGNTGQHPPRFSTLAYLEQAALYPDRRSDALDQALNAIAHEVAAVGTALLWPRMDGVSPWQVKYAGGRKKEMQRWLNSRLDASLQKTISAFAESTPCFPEARPTLFPLRPHALPLSGLWVVWPLEDLNSAFVAEDMDGIRQALESFVEVEHKEQLYFRDKNNPLCSEVAQALRNRDNQGLPALLILARIISDADVAYWGSVRDDFVDVEWHLGARNTGFGFQLPVGQGVGGRAFARAEAFGVPDYQNCQYRYPGVSDVADKEEVRSSLAVPVRSSTPQAGGVLFTARRTVAPFSAAQRLLLLRLARSIEPVPSLWPAPRYFFAPGTDNLKATRPGLRHILLHSNQVEDVESWLEQSIGGAAMLVDDEGRPYVPDNNDRFERLRFSSKAEEHGPQIVPLTSFQVGGGRGSLYLWPSVDLPPAGWPDFLDDIVVACSIVIDRVKQAHDRLNEQRSRWLKSLMEGRATSRSRREGNRLGLSVDQGEVWAIAWEPKMIESTDQTRLTMLAEGAVLDELGSPLVVLDDGIGISLFKEPAQSEPSVVRDELLKYLGPDPLWPVHGASYDSFDGLEDAMLRTVKLIERIRRDGVGRYISEVSSWGLDSLLENSKVSEEMVAFASRLLEPLLTYDRNTRSQLTETFCLALTLGSYEEAARRLFVHANTIQYRMRARPAYARPRALEDANQRTNVPKGAGRPTVGV